MLLSSIFVITVLCCCRLLLPFAHAVRYSPLLLPRPYHFKILPSGSLGQGWILKSGLFYARSRLCERIIVIVESVDRNLSTLWTSLGLFCRPSTARKRAFFGVDFGFISDLFYSNFGPWLFRRRWMAWPSVLTRCHGSAIAVACAAIARQRLFHT